MKQKEKREIYRAIFNMSVSVIGGKLGSAQRLLRPCRCGRMPRIKIDTFCGDPVIVIACGPVGCTVCTYNPAIYSLKQTAHSWNKKGRFFRNRWVKTAA